jgi:hypothetical protein
VTTSRPVRTIQRSSVPAAALFAPVARATGSCARSAAGFGALLVIRPIRSKLITWSPLMAQNAWVAGT